MKHTMKWIMENKWATVGIIVVLLAIVFGSIRTASAYDSCMTGSWHDPTVESEGINLEVLDNGVLAYFYSYNKTGNALRWYYMVFNDEGRASVGTVKNKIDRNPQNVGSATFDVIDQDNILILIDLNIDIDNPPWCLGCERTLVYTRLTQPVACD